VLHLEALTGRRDEEKVLPVPSVATPLRGLTEGKPTHYVMVLADGRFAAFGKVGARWQVQVGDRDTVLACLPDTLFAAAVAATVKS